MITLAFETSCDETSVAVLDDRFAPQDGGGLECIRAEITATQVAEHMMYGGVVPEIAARAHLHYLPDLTVRALRTAGITVNEVDEIAVTCGPGLLGGVLVGVMFARALAATAGKPLRGINHLEGHALSVRLAKPVAFPYLLLLVSGGHCQFLKVNGVCDYELLGRTLDDAAGEAFDKAAKMLRLGYPGGPALEQAAAQGNPARFSLPRPMIRESGCDMSFSGLKNAVRMLCESQDLSDVSVKADIAASFQQAVAQTLAARTANALDMCDADCGTLAVAGGVAANKTVRALLEETARGRGVSFVCPPLRLCTDNAAMIGWAAVEHHRAGIAPMGMDTRPRPRWPLSELQP